MTLHPPKRLMLRCTLCEPDGMYIEPTTYSGFGLYAAVDHALDLHRDELTLYPADTLAEIIATC